MPRPVFLHKSQGPCPFLVSMSDHIWPVNSRTQQLSSIKEVRLSPGFHVASRAPRVAGRTVSPGTRCGNGPVWLEAALDVGGCRKACAFLLVGFLMYRYRSIPELHESPRTMVSPLPHSSCPLGDFPTFLKSVQFMLESNLFYECLLFYGVAENAHCEVAGHPSSSPPHTLFKLFWFSNVFVNDELATWFSG